MFVYWPLFLSDFDQIRMCGQGFFFKSQMCSFRGKDGSSAVQCGQTDRQTNEANSRCLQFLCESTKDVGKGAALFLTNSCLMFFNTV